MVVVKTARELSKMKDACRISAEALRVAGEAVKPGVTTYEIDNIVRSYIEKQEQFPVSRLRRLSASACISVNNVVIHGIPSKELVLKEGDIVSVDVGAFYGGFHGDNAFTFPCGKISADAQALLDATKESLYEGIKQALAFNRVGDIGNAVQKYVEARSYSVVRDFVGHGVGAKLHEDPSVPNYGTAHRGVRLIPGMTIAIEPMVNQGRCNVRVLDDKWTTVTADGKLSAHFEHTVAITPDRYKIMTLCD